VSDAAADAPAGAGDGAGAGAVRLRPLRWWDVENVVPLERELFGATAWTAEAFWSELAAPSRWYVVAAEEAVEPDAGPTATGSERLLGYAGLMATGHEADVQTIGVAPSAQGRGIGARLLAALVGEAAARGATELLLEVRADNPAAIALYRRFGFEQIAVRRRYYQPGDVDALVMRLRPLRGSPEPRPAFRPPSGGAPGTASAGT
jgi:ribosomal-protein-alanine N-acetyltransferase